MQIIERVTKLIGPTQHFRLRKRTVLLRQHHREIFPADVLHYQELPVTFIKVIADARQRLMVHARQQAGFSLELFAKFFVSEEGFLQRYGSVETLVYRLVHGSHPTLAELANNPVTPLQNCVRCQHKSNP